MLTLPKSWLRASSGLAMNHFLRVLLDFHPVLCISNCSKRIIRHLFRSEVYAWCLRFETQKIYLSRCSLWLCHPLACFYIPTRTPTHTRTKPLAVQGGHQAAEPDGAAGVPRVRALHPRHPLHYRGAAELFDFFISRIVKCERPCFAV